jgi:hypothetical protein
MTLQRHRNRLGLSGSWDGDRAVDHDQPYRFGRGPRFIGRLFAGEAGVVMMTEGRGASNAKAKRELAWRPAHPSWREGFVGGLSEASNTMEVTACCYGH